MTRARPVVMGVVNATPDSFYDGGRVPDLIAHARRLVAEGADWIDVGGESTRAGAAPVDEDEELRRILPIIEALRDETTLSVDTTHPRVAARALAAGARVVNDVRGLSDPEMVAVSADAWGVVVMHSRGTPATMGQLTTYGDVVAEVREFLVAAATRCRAPRVWIDPGIGFAKTAAQSRHLLSQLSVLVDTGWPVLVGASRKSFIGATLGLPDPADRLYGSLAAAAAAWQRGASVFRVHDVLATRQLLDLLAALEA